MQMLDAKELEILHSLQLKILREIKRVCEECQIRFFLFGGTLLGAVRHQDFIPWDDDMDIAMLREDYETFVQLFPQHADGDTFFLENWDTEPGFGLPFSKVMLQDTVFEEHSTKNLTIHKGVFVDVFPLDSLPADLKSIQKTTKTLDRQVSLYKFRLGYLPTNPDNRKQHFLAKGIGVLGKLIPQKALRDRILQEITQYNKDPSAPYLAPIGGGGDHRAHVFSKKAVEETLMVPFAEEQLPIPAGYHEILSAMFGNYMELPPVEKRVFRHHPERVDFGAYATGVPQR